MIKIQKFKRIITQHYRYIVLVLIIASIIFGTLLLSRLNASDLSHWKQVAEVLQHFSVSFGSLLAGLGGLGLIEDWLKRRERRDNIVKYWQKRFPISSINKNYKYSFIQKAGSEGIIYLYDQKGNQKHWIANLETLRKIWGPNPKRDTMKELEFDTIPTGEHIDATT